MTHIRPHRFSVPSDHERVLELTTDSMFGKNMSSIAFSVSLGIGPWYGPENVSSDSECHASHQHTFPSIGSAEASPESRFLQMNWHSQLVSLSIRSLRSGSSVSVQAGMTPAYRLSGQTKSTGSIQ